MTLVTGRHARGFTLLELLVVLFILAALAGTATLSMETLVDQERRTATVRALDSARDAVLGRTGIVDPTGHLWAEGFVSDVGRLPLVLDGPERTRLRELWTKPDEVRPFSIQSPKEDPEVRLPAGWRGPYLRLPLGADGWRDGWGEPYRALMTQDGNPALPGEVVESIASHGLDDRPGGEGYDEDLVVVFRTADFSHHLGDLLVRVRPIATPAATTITVRVYGPIDGKVSALGDPPELTWDGEDAIFEFEDLPIGNRVVRAYQTVAAKTDPPKDGPQVGASVFGDAQVGVGSADGAGPSLETGELKSAITPIVLVAGGNPELQLEIRAN